MATEVISAMGLDFASSFGDIISIREKKGSDAHFVLSCLFSKYIQFDYNICLVTLHHTFNHYHNVGMKLGYNMNALKEKGNIRIIEIMKFLVQNENFSNNLKETLFNEVLDNLKTLKHKPILIVIDDISHLFDLDFSTRDILIFIKHIKSFVHENYKASVIIKTHVASKNEEVIANILQHSSNLNIDISPLRTGTSTDISGKMEVFHRNFTNQHEQNVWNKQNSYHYKLQDRFVKVFAPGLIS